jgi:hypothetical protein
MRALQQHPELAELEIADPPERWRAIGFDVQEGNLDIGGVRLRLGGDGGGIRSWSLNRLEAIGSIDGLVTPAPRMLRPPPFVTHPNGATGLDHVVILTPDFERTAGALSRAGMPLKRTTEEHGRGRQGFRRIGPAILELVDRPDLDGGHARFWGLVVVVISLEALAERLGELLAEIRPAVQQGRRIATLRSAAGLSPAVAFMSPEV